MLLKELQEKAESENGIMAKVSQRGLLLTDGNAYDSEAIRSFALYWDCLRIPVAGHGGNEAPSEAELIALNSRSEFEILQKEGMLSIDIVPTRVWRDEDFSFKSGYFDQFPTFDLWALHMTRSRYNIAFWSIARARRPAAAKQEKEASGRAALVELYRVLPVPTTGVPIADLLKFKSKRSDELIGLRSHLEETYQAIIAAPDIQLKAMQEVEKLQRALVDIAKCTNETRLPFTWGGWEVKLSFEIQGAALGAAAGGLIGSLGNHSVDFALLAAAVGVAVGGLKGSISTGLRSLENVRTPLQYIASAEKEFSGLFVR